MQTTAFIMAGGRGERFWPKSRKSLPKQFLSLTGDEKTMIQLTIERICPLVALDDVYVATNECYRELVKEQIPGLPEENILCEPVGRNTAPCIGLGAMHISRKYKDALMFVLPSDHLIKSQEQFLDVLREAGKVAQKGSNLVTIGVTPKYPETGYGYIKYQPDEICGSAYAVEKFVEKPGLDQAKEYLAAGKYLWNSGMFVWKVSTILENLRQMMPDTYMRLQKIRDSIGTEKESVVLRQEFTAMESQSIDYGIMEKAKDIYTLLGNFGWDDVGSWLAVGRLQDSDKAGNVIEGNVVEVDTSGCIILGEKKLLAAVGLKDTVIVDTEDVTLICDKKSTGSIRRVLEILRNSQKEQYI